MKLTWLALVIILFDQSVKLLTAMSGIGNNGASFVLGPVTIELNRSPLLSEQSIYASLANSTTLIMIAGILAAYFLLIRKSRHLYFISTTTSVGLQLAAGGLTSYAIDEILRGDIHSTLRLKLFENFTLNAGIADQALIIGLVVLLYSLLGAKTKVESRFPLYSPTLNTVNFSRIPRGIDNIHIDVLLSPEFQKKCTLLIHRLIPLVISNHKEGKKQFKLPDNAFTAIQSDFNTLFSLSLRKAKELGVKQLPDLLYIAFLKFLHAEVSNSVAATIKFTRENVNEHRLRGLGRRNDSSYVEWLFRYRDTIVTSTNLTLLQGLFGDNRSAIAKAFQSILGLDQPFSLQTMNIPMVLAETPHDEHLQIAYYLVLGQEQNDNNSFVRIDKELADIFADYLDLIEQKPEENPRRDSGLQSEGHINSNIIDSLSQPSVLMHPANITILLDTGWTSERLANTSGLKSPQEYRQLKLHLKFQKTLQTYLLNHMHREGHASWINANYAVKEIFDKHNTDLSPYALIKLLANGVRKEEFTHQLKELLSTTDIPPDSEQLVQTGKEIRQQSGKLFRDNLLHFIEDFARYRRDLLLLLSYLRSATQVNLLTDDNDIQTSRANYTLHEFLLPHEIKNKQAKIQSHIIIKADIRGSTEVTEKLTELDLNPATHFGRNFFIPINEVITSYGAEKIFIEGDAIILALTEYADTKHDSMIASRACGLAARILQIVAKQNKELEVYGLPALELGVGIAFCDRAPNYLFDKQQRITISPAINRADRLSSCTQSVRKWRERQQVTENFVEVYQPSDIAEEHGEKAQKDVIFNLNGILVEPAVFDKLRQELTLKPLNNTLPSIQDSKLYAFTSHDLTGDNHSLVLRQAPVKEFDPGYQPGNCPTIKHRYFYEVIYRREVLGKLRRRS